MNVGMHCKLFRALRVLFPGLKAVIAWRNSASQPIRGGRNSRLGLGLASYGSFRSTQALNLDTH